MISDTHSIFPKQLSKIEYFTHGRAPYTVTHKHCTTVHSHQQGARGPISLHTHQHLLFSAIWVFFLIANIMGINVLFLSTYILIKGANELALIIIYFFCFLGGFDFILIIFYQLCCYSFPNFPPPAPLHPALPTPSGNPHTLIHVQGSCI